MIDLIAPAIFYRLKQHGLKGNEIQIVYQRIIDCIFHNICRKSIQPYMNIDVIQFAKKAVTLKDKNMAARLYSWYLMCTKKRVIRDFMVEETGEIVYKDVTDGLMRLYPPPEFPC